jgi:threonine/homoserine/homoserine lactone efflux protein
VIAAALIGFAFGFFGSVPIAGPIAALVLQRGLTGRYKDGAAIGLGCAVAEAGYAFLAWWGFSTFLAAYPIVEPLSRLLAALILFGLGISFARYRGPTLTDERPPAQSTSRSLLLGFSITALNPTLIATWSAATTTLYSTGLIAADPINGLPFASGTFGGIAGWFLLLTYLLKRYGARFRRETMDLTVRAVGWLIVLLSLFFAYRFVSFGIERQWDLTAPRP